MWKANPFREISLLRYMQEEAEEEGKYDHVDHDLLGVGCEVELPSTVSCEKHYLDSECKIFIQSDVASDVKRRPARQKGPASIFKVPQIPKGRCQSLPPVTYMPPIRSTHFCNIWPCFEKEGVPLDTCD